MMHIAYINLSGFRGYKEETRINFAPGFNIISGRNGVGKSTLCDAIEYVLTGTIDKYSGATADGESVENYIWWRGKTPASNSFVEVGFVDDDNKIHSLKRVKGGSQPENLNAVTKLLCHSESSPVSPLSQLCKSNIIRDEFISTLSLDLKESERFQLLRDALGTPDSDAEIQKANELKKECSERMRHVDFMRENARNHLKEINAKIEQLRAKISEDSAIKSAAEFLNNFLAVNLPADKLVPLARDTLAQKHQAIDKLDRFLSDFSEQKTSAETLSDLKKVQNELKNQASDLDKQISILSDEYTIFMNSTRSLGPTVNIWSNLLSHAQQLTIDISQCPVCSTKHSHESFAAGLKESYARLHGFSSVAKDMSNRQLRLEEELQAKRVEKEKLNTHLFLINANIFDVEKRLMSATESEWFLKLPEPVTTETIIKRIKEERDSLLKIESSLRVLETIAFNQLLETAQREKSDIEARIAELEAQLALARKSESRAKALHDATRRATNEALDDRLDLIGPLLGDLYRRLRPHTAWRSIDYKIRGDIKRFLSLEVGEGLNPQFIFSSGQRRATGLAFLISIYLATSWSKFKTIVLDDPVQHIDDFRALHLVEVLASLHGHGHQVICAVEDAALADLLCRRLPVRDDSKGLHIELGENEFGNLGVICGREIVVTDHSILSN